MFAFIFLVFRIVLLVFSFFCILCIINHHYVPDLSDSMAPDGQWPVSE